MTLLFIACPRCGQITDEPEILAAVRHRPWHCPACGAENAPLCDNTRKQDPPE